MGIREFLGRSPEPEDEAAGRTPDQVREDTAVMCLNLESAIKSVQDDLANVNKNDRSEIRHLKNRQKHLGAELKRYRDGGITDADLRAAKEKSLRRLELEINSHETALKQEIDDLERKLSAAKAMPQPDEEEIQGLMRTLRKRQTTLNTIPSQRQGLAKDWQRLETKYPTKQVAPPE